jgi:hypothetical protein
MLNNFEGKVYSMATIWVIKFFQNNKVTMCIFLGILLSILLWNPTAAVAGPNCSSVKSKITRLEKNINIVISSWALHRGSSLSSQQVANLRKTQNDTKPFYEIFKTAYNAPECFSRTQNDWISSNWDKNNQWSLINYQDLIDWSYYPIRKTTSKCQTWLQERNPTSDCLIRWEYVLLSTQRLPSIYSK